ncbi:MAG TPA: YHS domain-containing (seleno)protein [Candidatus Methylacidiphilales bacterium]|nr:YHS domain-containing (seleno)protein [Candidatus Methylacidiphilales bacterium]
MDYPVKMMSAVQANALVNVDRGGLALQGYDPVAYFTERKPVKGRAGLRYDHEGTIYYFSSDINRSLFINSPSKYEPQFGGYCAYGVSRGKLVPVDVNAFQIVNDRLLLQYSTAVRDQFLQDSQGNLKLADQKWPTLVSTQSKQGR